MSTVADGPIHTSGSDQPRTADSGKRYHTPTLHVYGEISDLTRTNGGPGIDAFTDDGANDSTAGSN